MASIVATGNATGNAIGSGPRAILATRAQFLTLGLVAGAFGAHVPSLAARYQLDARTLSGALLCATLGSLTMLVAAGPIIGRLGARRTTQVSALAFSAALALLLQLPTAWALVPVMMLLGAGESLFDIAINAEGTMLEQLAGRTIMSSFHAMFSVGAMLGSGLVALAFRAAMTPATQLLALGAGALLVAGTVADGMLPAHPSTGGAHFTWPRGPLLTIGLLILAGMTAEGLMYNWSVLYVRQELAASADRAALAYVCFSAATAVMRFAGDAMRARWSERRILLVGSAVASAAMLTVLLARRVDVAYVGFALVGAGLATVVPILYNATTRVPGVSRAAALASASSIGYVGFLIGPPLVGGIAQATSLTVAMGVLLVACAALMAGAGRVPLGPRVE